jgi:hypothetical protein
MAGAGADGVFGSGSRGISRFFPVHMRFPRSFPYGPEFARGRERINTVDARVNRGKANIVFLGFYTLARPFTNLDSTALPDGAVSHVAEKPAAPCGSPLAAA